MNKTNKATASFIKKYRNKLGITQKDLAERMGVSVTAVQNWESGITNINQNNYERLSVVFGISLETLLREMAADKECRGKSSWPGFLFDDELNSIIAKLQLTREQQDLFGCLHIYGARFLNEDELETEVITDIDAGSREETERRIFTEDLRRIPVDFINRVGSINFLNNAEGLFKLIRYIKPEFLLKVLTLEPEQEFNIKNLSKELIAEFIDSGLKDWVKDGREFDFSVNISMFKARIILPFLNNKNEGIILANSNSQKPQGEMPVELRADLPEETRKVLLKMQRITDEEWQEEWKRDACRMLARKGRYNIYAVCYHLEDVTDLRNVPDKDGRARWILSINDRGRELLKWFSE